MNAQTLLPPIPQPPHDPTSWLLNTRVGWHAAQPVTVEETPPSQALTLALSPESRRALTENSGSFGGLTVPANVALVVCPSSIDRL